MTNETLLTYLLRGPNGRVQSFLEGIFNPVVQYDEVTNGILGQLSNDDHSAMRRTNSTMNSSLMALRYDGIFRHRPEALRDTCDVVGLRPRSRRCPNGTNSSARLTRCSRREKERGFAEDIGECHRDIKVFLVCTTCDERIRNQPRTNGVYEIREAHWPVCAVCTETQEEKYPRGARFCNCLAEMKRRVLCESCTEARLRYLDETNDENFQKRHTIWRDDKGKVKFGHRSPGTLDICLGCGVRPFNFVHDYPFSGDVTRICLFCSKYDIVPSRRLPANNLTVSLPLPVIHTLLPPRPPVRRSARLNPTDLQAAAHIMLSHCGTIQKPNAEPQGPYGFPIPSPRRQKSPRGKHVM